MRKFVILAVIGIVVASVAGVILLFTGLGSVVGFAIEKSGSAVTGTHVRVAGVDLSLREGTCSVEGIRVASPDGFRAADAFVLNGISVDMDVASVRKDPVVIEEVRIRTPEVHAEFLEDGSSNVDELRRRAQAHAGGKAKGAADTRNLRIGKLVFEGGEISVDASALGVEPRTVTLPGFQLDGIGGDAGVPPDEVAQVVLTALAKKTAQEIAGNEVQRLIEKKLGGPLTDTVKGLLDRTGH